MTRFAVLLQLAGAVVWAGEAKPSRKEVAKSPSQQLIETVRKVEDECRRKDFKELKAAVGSAAGALIQKHGAAAFKKAKMRYRDDAYPVEVLTEGNAVFVVADTRVWTFVLERQDAGKPSVGVRYTPICVE